MVVKILNERTFLFEEIKGYLDENVDFYLFGDGMEERDRYLKEWYLGNFSEKCIELHYDVKTEKFSGNDGLPRDLKADLDRFLQETFGDREISIFLDITSLPTALLFYLLLNLRGRALRHLFCGYTKPSTYRRANSVGERERYQLNDGFIGIKPIPGFLRSDPAGRERILILFLGYEGSRAKYIYEEESPSSMVPVIGLPGFRPGWNDTAFEMNLDLIGETSSMDYVEYIAADSPFEAYALLEKMQSVHNGKYLVIGPLGTKASSLGVALYAINTELECSIIYDNPTQKENSTDGKGSTLIYDITSLLCDADISVVAE